MKQVGQSFSGKNTPPTKILVEEGKRGEVAAQAEELRHHHQPMPRPDGQRHHQQLRQDERREGDGHHVHELRLEEHQRTVHEDAAWRQQKETEWRSLRWNF